MSNQLVSIIVPCYNQEQYLKDALESVLAQTYTKWECVIVNDGSTDMSESIAKEYCQRDERFMYIYQQNQGVVIARNNGIKGSHGQYVLPLDGDDIIDSTFLEKAVAVLDSNEEIKIVACRFDFIGEAQGEFKFPSFTLADLLICNCLVNTSMFRREDFDRVGGYNQNMANGMEDWDFWISILEDSGEVYKIDEILFHYRISSQSRNQSAKKEEMQLRYTIAQNHSRLLYDEYNKMYQTYVFIERSRSYKLARAIYKVSCGVKVFCNTLFGRLLYK